MPVLRSRSHKGGNATAPLLKSSLIDVVTLALATHALNNCSERTTVAVRKKASTTHNTGLIMSMLPTLSHRHTYNRVAPERSWVRAENQADLSPSRFD